MNRMGLSQGDGFFREAWVNRKGVVELFFGQPRGDRNRETLNNFSSFRPNQMQADHLFFAVGDHHFYESSDRRIGHKSFAHRFEFGAIDFDGFASESVDGLRFRESHDTDFDGREDSGGDRIVPHFLGTCGVQTVGESSSGFDGHGSQSGASGHITHRVDMGSGSPFFVIDADEASIIELNTGAVEPKIFDVGGASHGGQNHIEGLLIYRAIAGLDAGAKPVVRGFDSLHGRSHVNIDTETLIERVGMARNLVVEGSEHAIEGFHERDFRSEGRQDSGEFHADVPAADDETARRKLGQSKEIIADEG